ncbi:RidA family protein [Oceanobacillus sojae]|uniref:RidA family protein n=1 Tax=Oceanobacillus sojae TaxID=582851 RepID=UPI0009886811|nr:RidA family protein [Oceanobacillus sojae]
MIQSEENVPPVPQGKYIPASRVGDLIFTSGMTPRHKGGLIQTGKVSTEEPLHIYRQAVRLAVSNALNAINNILNEDEKLNQILALNVYVNAQENFQAHSGIADFASEYLYEQLGQNGIGSRAAIGVASLPGNAPIEIQITAVCTKY